MTSLGLNRGLYYCQVPENPCCYSTCRFCTQMRTARCRNRFSALDRSSVIPFFRIPKFGKEQRNATFLASTAPPVGVARNTNHSFILHCSPKILLCLVQFFSSRMSRMRLFFAATPPSSRKSMLLSMLTNAHCQRSGPFSCS